MADDRFKHIATDPKFRPIPKRERKVKIDKRFQSMFSDKKFKVKYTTDKRGRPISHTSTEDLKRYYDLSSESETESEEVEESGKYVKAAPSEPSGLEIKQKSDNIVSDETRKKLKNLNVNYARGESKLCSDSSSDDEESEDDELSETDQIDHKWGELDADAEQTEQATCRLAACNMNWDRIRAVDLMVLFNSFLPAGGAIKSVCIYPSKYGKERMKEEDIKGPIELVESISAENGDEQEEGSSYHMEKLRQYQLNRLKYYYAVIVFDNANSANKIYTECDGMEYESSAIKLDLRFIPDDMDFEDKPKDFCDQLPEINKYQPRFFTTTALQQAKVDLTWDETNPDRLEFAQKLNSNKINDISVADFQNYLASSSGEDENSEGEKSEEVDSDGGKNIIDKYKSLLQNIEDSNKAKKDDVQMEISWGLDLQEKTNVLMKEKINGVEDKTPFQKYLEKRKQKKKEKRKQQKHNNSEDARKNSDSDIPSDIDMSNPYFAEEFNDPAYRKVKTKKTEELADEKDQQNHTELELLLMNEDSDNKKHFSLKKIQESETTTKKKKGKEEISADDFEVNVEDSRFSALFTSHHYNIDPTDPHFKKTKAMELLINEKLKRRLKNPEENEKSIVKKVRLEDGRDKELSLLVKSVKRKAEEFLRK